MKLLGIALGALLVGVLALAGTLVALSEPTASPAQDARALQAIRALAPLPQSSLALDGSGAIPALRAKPKPRPRAAFKPGPKPAHPGRVRAKPVGSAPKPRPKRPTR